ncbi:hypothetical protein H2248_010164 [Termitomyces sp. 'cryptogamus']|nr:hypothetical protein H2248_010164 [Termitomyces sp. 'cryptogamus']
MGRRGANHAAVLFAAGGILACGCSFNMEMLIISRFISGIGGGGISMVSGIIISDMYSLRTRGFLQSISGVFYGLGMGLGGPIGGLVTDWFGWRWAFLMQVPLFALCFGLTFFNLHYDTPGNGRPALEILERIDYGGSACLLVSVGSMLYFLSTRYNEGLEWSEPSVWIPSVIAIVFLVLFLVNETYIAYEPVLPIRLLRRKIPFLVGCSNAFVAVCNFSIIYFFPLWFQTVMLSSTSTAGLHLLPNSICISIGNVFAGWMMQRTTGQYKLLNLVFGILPLVGTMLIREMREDSGQAYLWLSIVPSGLGNAVVSQTMYIALMASLPQSQLAIGTGFAQLVRGLGQVGGLAAASAIFQSRLNTELRARIHTPDAEETIKHIRHSSRLIGELPPVLQRIARDAYAASLKSVFTLAVCASLMAFLCCIPSCSRSPMQTWTKIP